MPLCIRSDSVSEAMVDAGQQVTCPICHGFIGAELAADLAEENDWPQFRGLLASSNIVACGETAEEFSRFQARMSAYIAPVGLLEELYTERALAVAW